MYKKILILFLFVSCSSWAQLANDCVDAIVVCGNSSVASNSSGFGTQELDNTANDCLFEETNSIWLQLNIAESGSLSFVITPDNENIVVDYDFFVFGPSSTCGNFNDPIRCSTTNPQSAGLTSNTTGLRDSENDQNEGPGPGGNSFVSAIPVIAGETYYLLVDRPIGNGGFSLEWTSTSEFFDAPLVNEPDDINLCVASLATTVDLTPTRNGINTNPEVEVSLHTSLADAFDGRNSIEDPEAYPIERSRNTIYAKIQGMNGCFEIAKFNIKTANFIDVDLEYKLCDQDGNNIESFSLATIFGDIQNTLINALDFNISFHSNYTNANTATSPLPIFNFNSESTIIFARIQSTIDVSCFASIPIDLEVISSPIPVISQLVQCDVDETNFSDGITALNLEQVFGELPNADEYNFLFYETPLERTNNNPIPNLIGYSNTVAFSQTIFYKAINIEVGCENLGELQIQVQPTTVSLNTESPFFDCDENPDDTIFESTFDLENIGQVNYSGLETSFYTSLEDLTLELNAVSGNYTTESTTLYVRIENSNQCQGVEEIELIVNPTPSFEIPETYLLCTDGNPLEISAPTGFDTYRWIRMEGNAEQEISNTQNAAITNLGNYSLEVGIQYINAGETTLCTSMRNFEVLPSNRAIIQEINIEDISENNTIQVIVDGDGIYEFSIDGENYQDSNFFENVEAGIVSVFVRDKNGCGIIEEIISVIGYPKFFTPNNDNINDFWQIIGLEDGATQSISIFIYDRYGKLIKQISPSSKGWDGTYINASLPASDYWFVANLADNRQFKGHFALKR